MDHRDVDPRELGEVKLGMEGQEEHQDPASPTREVRGTSGKVRGAPQDAAHRAHGGLRQLPGQAGVCVGTPRAVAGQGWG